MTGLFGRQSCGANNRFPNSPRSAATVIAYRRKHAAFAEIACNQDENAIAFDCRARGVPSQSYAIMDAGIEDGITTRTGASMRHSPRSHVIKMKMP